MKAYVFPGQGAQFVGMGKDLYEQSPRAKELFEQANEILGFRITDLMFDGQDEDLKQTKVTQPAIFLHSVILASTLEQFHPDMVAGHSLGEFSALVAAGVLDFGDAMYLVHKRGQFMIKANQGEPFAMYAIIGLPPLQVKTICEEASAQGIVIAANFNTPVQTVISGSRAAFSITVLPSARHAAIIIFSVPPTVGMSKMIWPPFNFLQDAFTYPCEISTLAPMASSALM